MKRQHPILSRPRQLGWYLAVLMASSVLLNAVANGGDTAAGWRHAMSLGAPLGLGQAVIGLLCWWIYRAIPQKPSLLPLVFTHTVLAVLSSRLLLLAASGLELAFGLTVEEPPMWIIGILLYLLTAAFHHLVPLVASSRLEASRSLASRARSREAELKALEAQVQPHFLFNSLHSLSALCGFDPAGARRMAILLADFFRGRVEAGRKDWLALRDEIELIEKYLAIEKVRFERRLTAELRVDPEARDCRLPPFLLQPLIENAVKHGIASLVEGGTVSLDARRAEDRLEIRVTNPCDPERPRARGTRTGLANVKGRLLTLFGPRSSFEIDETPSRFQVTLSLPVETGELEIGSPEEDDHD